MKLLKPYDASMVAYHLHLRRRFPGSQAAHKQRDAQAASQETTGAGRRTEPSTKLVDQNQTAIKQQLTK
jgi:hypothetical protein